MKRTYRSPLLVEVDESENVNADDTSSETMYFEF